MDIKKIYYEFIEKYPAYAKDIIKYEEDKDKSIKFTLSNGTHAWYYPLLNDIEED